VTRNEREQEEDRRQEKTNIEKPCLSQSQRTQRKNSYLCLKNPINLFFLCDSSDPKGSGCEDLND
jgi:hypothetical protein